MKYQLAQLNIAKMTVPLDDPRIQDFVDALDPVNAIADSTPGFVWRLKSDDGNAMGFEIYGDPGYLVNISVWESPDALREFVINGNHLAIMKRRAEWFEKSDLATMVLWWVPVGHTPSVAEAQDRLDRLRADGPTEYAFSFSTHYPPPKDAP